MSITFLYNQNKKINMLSNANEALNPMSLYGHFKYWKAYLIKELKDFQI